MPILEQEITDQYALYNGDGLEVLPLLPSGSVHMTIYSPPFAKDDGGCLYHYSSSDRDLSNCRDYAEFFTHYEFFVREIYRVTMPGRISLVHCIDVPSGNTGDDDLADFPGDIIRLHKKCGFRYKGRYHVWKEPLTVRNRLMIKSLAHKTIVEDSSKCSVASADYVLIFKREGKNPIPIAHPVGLTEYAGFRKPPADVLRYKGWTGNQIENRYSHWIWRQYASSFWDDVRLDRVLPFREAREYESACHDCGFQYTPEMSELFDCPNCGEVRRRDEKHVHALQLDVIDRGLILYSNPGETVLSPFAGVGSEPYGAVRNGRRGIGIELKSSYFRQAVKNLNAAATDNISEEGVLDFEGILSGTADTGIMDGDEPDPVPVETEPEEVFGEI
jgi:DNA modification methylase